MSNEGIDKEKNKLEEPKKKSSIIKIIYKSVVVVSIVFILLVIWGYTEKSKNPIDDYPVKIKDVEKEYVLKALNQFIDDRNEVVQNGMIEFDNYIKNIVEGGSYSNLENLFNYGYIINLEKSFKTNTYKVVSNYIENNANGVYVNDSDEEKLLKKAEKIDEDIYKHKKFIEKKYKKINLYEDFTTNGSTIYNYFTNLKIIKEFLLNNLKQEDINEAVLNYRYKTTTTNSVFGITFESNPILWDKFKNKIHHKEPLAGYYITNALNFSTNEEFYKLDTKVKSTVEKIVRQSIHGTRYGYFFSDFEKLKINLYLDENKVIAKIEKMVDEAIKNVENISLSTDNYLLFEKKLKYSSNEKITITKNNPKYKPSNISLWDDEEKVYEPKTIKETVFKYKDIFIERKVGFENPMFKSKFISGYVVNYKKVNELELTLSYGQKMFFNHLDTQNTEVFKTLKEAKNYVQVELKGIRIED